MERSLSQNSKLKVQYVDFMREYEALGHMKEVKEQDIPKQNYFIPHPLRLKAKQYLHEAEIGI